MNKPARAGKRIRSLNDLVNATYERRSVIGTYYPASRPAAAVLNMQGRTIANSIERGLWIYKPKKRIDLNKPPKGWTPRKPAAPTTPVPILNLPYNPDL